MESVLERLSDHPDGLSKQELVTRIGRTSGPTVQRALAKLRDVYGAPIAYEQTSGKWVLHDRSFRMPMEVPEPDDVRAVLIAEAMLEPIADDALRKRLRRLAEQLDDRIRARQPRGMAGTRSAVKGRTTLGTRLDPRHLATLLDAMRRHPLRIVYDKPWENERVRHTVEPWGVCVFDGAIYFRAFVRESGDARTFRLAQVETMLASPGERFETRLPPIDRVWDERAPAFGIDEDRPGVAVLRLCGGVARWVHRTIWHPDQRDQWIDEPELLERTVPYRSCREIARRILSILDGIQSIHPPELRTQVETMVASYQSRSQPTELPKAPLARTTSRSDRPPKRRKARP